MKKIFIALVGMAVAMPSVFAANTWYVSPNGNDGNSGATWALAKKTIQAGVDAAASNDTVLVTNGEYVLSGQITVSKTITVRSVNGPSGTIVNGNGQVTLSRCFYLGTNCTLDGFTVTNGYVVKAGGAYCVNAGGGAYCVNASIIITNCTLTGNTAGYGGGGVSDGTLNNCTLIGNTANGVGFGVAGSGGGASGSTLNNCMLIRNTASGASIGGGIGFGGAAVDSTLNNCTLIGNSANDGGGAFDSSLNNCTLAGNSASSGGGAYDCSLNNCTLSGNSATNGSGARGGILNNCIVYYNIGTNNIHDGTIRYTCAPDAPAGLGNITNAPMFVNTNTGNYRLLFGSPCINAGHNALVPTNVPSLDLDGNSRIWDVTVDMGAYEYGSVPPDPVIKANGSTNDIIITSGTNLSITAQIDPGQYQGINADWWVVALAGYSWYYLNNLIQWTPFDGNLSNCQPVHQGALFDLSATEILNITGLSTGLYTFWFAVDPMDGAVNLDGPIWLDSVNVLVQ